MSIDLNMAVILAAVSIMMFALWRVATMKKSMPGGAIGKSWNLLFGLVALFAVGYIAVPFLGQLEKDVLELLVSFIFLFGAVYVVITVNLIDKVIKVLAD